MTPKDTTMKAYIAKKTDKGGVLELIERDIPQPGSGEILIKVSTAGINRLDILQRKGHYPPPLGATDVLGVEAAGEVVACGSNASQFNPGDKVMALLPGGGYADYVTIHESNVLPIPHTLSPLEAGGFPETFFTVWSNVFDRGGLKSGETFLVHGGSSGIGTTAIQLAKAFGAFVIATAGSDEKCDACQKLGADATINYRDLDFVEAVKEITKGTGAHVILDMVGGDYVPRNYKAAAFDGRIIQIAFLRGGKPAMDLGLLTRKRLVHTGATLRSRSLEDKAAIASALRQHVLPLVETGLCKPVIDSVFPFIEAAKAHERMEEGSHIGKIILTLT